ETVHIRQMKVEKDKIRHPRGKRLEGMRSIMCGNDFETKLANHRVQKLHFFTIGIHHQQTIRAGGLCYGSGHSVDYSLYKLTKVRLKRFQFFLSGKMQLSAAKPVNHRNYKGSICKLHVKIAKTKKI